MPMYTTKNRKGELVSLSDHEALDAEFLIGKSNVWFKISPLDGVHLNISQSFVFPTQVGLPSITQHVERILNITESDFNHTFVG